LMVRALIQFLWEDTSIQSLTGIQMNMNPWGYEDANCGPECIWACKIIKKNRKNFFILLQLQSVQEEQKWIKLKKKINGLESLGNFWKPDNLDWMRSWKHQAIL
jgi:hypothetical protein